MITTNVSIPRNILNELESEFFVKHTHDRMPFDIFLGMQAGLEASRLIKMKLETDQYCCVPNYLIPDEWLEDNLIEVYITDYDYTCINRYISLLESKYLEVKIISSLVASSILH